MEEQDMVGIGHSLPGGVVAHERTHAGEDDLVPEEASSWLGTTGNLSQ